MPGVHACVTVDRCRETDIFKLFFCIHCTHIDTGADSDDEVPLSTLLARTRGTEYPLEEDMMPVDDLLVNTEVEADFGLNESASGQADGLDQMDIVNVGVNTVTARVTERLNKLESVTYAMDEKIDKILEILTRRARGHGVSTPVTVNTATPGASGETTPVPMPVQVMGSPPAVTTTQNVLPAFKVVDVQREIVAVGRDASSTIRLHKSELEYCFTSGKTPIGFALRLVGKLYSRAELAQSNYSGGTINLKDGCKVLKKALDKVKLQAIIHETQFQFPGTFITETEMKKFRDAVNGKCRHTKLN